MQAPGTPYSLPLQRPRVNPDLRPHTVHASSPSFPAEEQSMDDEQTPRGSLAGLGILPETVQRRSRDDAVDMQHYSPDWQVDDGGEQHQEGWPNSASWSMLRAQREQREQRQSGGVRLPVVFGQNGVPFGQTAQRSTTLPRRFSKGYKERISGFKENMTSKYQVTAGRIRRSSTPQSLETGTLVPRFGASVIVPTSPSKRNGKHEGDRPLKQHRHFLKTGDRKDTPAPLGPGLARPSSRHTVSNMIVGGDRARKAAAAFKTPTYFSEPVWEGRKQLEFNRARVGSLSSAADSGADLSSCYDDSNASYRDYDGDIDMYSPEPVEEPTVFDPLKKLPREIALQVFEFLDAKDLVNVELVNSAWKSTANQTSVWRSAFLRKYGRQIFTDPAPVQVGGMGVGRKNRPNQEWKKMFEAREQLDRNWRKGAKGAGKAIYLSGHTDSVYCVQFDEDKIITGSRDRTIRVWDINNFTCQRVIGGPTVKPVVGPKILRTVDYPDFHLATASVNGTAYGDTIYHTPSEWHDASILCLQYDEKILVTGSSDNDLLVWDIKTYEPIKRLVKHTGGVLDVTLDSKHIVSCSKDSRIIVWDRDTYEPKGELTGHRGPVNAVQLRGKFLVSASGDGIARLWDIEEMKLVKEFPGKDRGLAAVEFSEDMKYVLAGGNDTITYKFEVETGKEVQQFSGHSQLVRSLWLDSQNSRIVSGSYDLDLRVYDFNTGVEIWRAEEWTTSWMLAAKSDYRRIVATSQDGRILVIDFGIQKCCTPDDGQPILNVDLLRGTENTNAIQWRDPWERARQQQRERDRIQQRHEELMIAHPALLR